MYAIQSEQIAYGQADTFATHYLLLQ